MGLSHLSAKRGMQNLVRSSVAARLTVDQVLLLLLAPQVTLSHRPKDSDLIKTATESAKGKYKEISGRQVEVKLESSLSDESAGGVVGTSMGGKIKVDNTLDERLKILREKVSAG